MTSKTLKTRITKALNGAGFKRSIGRTTSIRGFSPASTGYTYERENPFDKTSEEYLVWKFYFTHHYKQEEMEAKVRQLYEALPSELKQYTEYMGTKIRLIPHTIS